MENTLNENLANFDDNSMEEVLNTFYSCFENGYEFENFLKVYLNKIGLDEIVVTKKSHDHGIDLRAKRLGLYYFNNVDDIIYIVQAKRYKPNNSIPPKEINALRGTMIEGAKGLFITTAKFSREAISIAESEEYRSKPIVLIDGISLVKSCMEKGIGFKYVPKIDVEDIKEMSKEKCEIINGNSVKTITEDEEISLNIIDKLITDNDIKARIMRIPTELKEKIDLTNESIKAIINYRDETILSIDKTKKYFARVTDLYRKFQLLKSDGSTNSKIVKMFVKDNLLNLIFDEK